MPPPPYMHALISYTAVIKNVVYSKTILKFEESFPLVCSACRDKHIDIYNTMHFDQFSHLAFI